MPPYPKPRLPIRFKDPFWELQCAECVTFIPLDFEFWNPTNMTMCRTCRNIKKRVAERERTRKMIPGYKAGKAHGYYWNNHAAIRAQQKAHRAEVMPSWQCEGMHNGTRWVRCQRLTRDLSKLCYAHRKVEIAA